MLRFQTHDTTSGSFFFFFKLFLNFEVGGVVLLVFETGPCCVAQVSLLPPLAQVLGLWPHLEDLMLPRSEINLTVVL